MTYFGIPESTWAYILGMPVLGLIVGSIVVGLASEAQLRRRLRRDDPELYAAVEAERAKYKARRIADGSYQYQGDLSYHAAKQFVTERHQSLWSDLGRFLAFWRSHSA